MTRDELDNQILWAEALLESLEDGDTSSAIEAIEGWLKLMRLQRKLISGEYL